MTEEKHQAETTEARVKGTRAARMQRPPEVAAADIDRLFERIRTIAPPAKVDAAWSRSFDLKDATIILSWLGLVKNGKVEDAALWNRVRMPATREDALADLVRTSYEKIFAEVDVAEASREDLEGAFVHEYNLGDTRRYIRAFAKLCKHAGIPVTAFHKSGDATSTAATPKTPTEQRAPVQRKTKAAASPRSDAAPKEAPASRDGSKGPASGINVNIEIPADWTEDQIRERVATVKRALAEAGD
jgi:hypothetical protein